MQSKANTNKKNLPPQAVKKPYLKGLAISGLAARRGLRITVYLLLSGVLFFFLGQLLVIGVSWLRVLLNLLVLLAFAALLYNQGARDGEGDVAFAEIALLRKNDLKPISGQDLARCYHPGKGFFTVLTGALPIVIVCLVYAFIAKRDTYTLGPLPSWLGAYETRADIGLALRYYHERAGFGFADFLRLIVRLMVFPFINMVGSGNSGAVLLVERLSPLLVVLAPLGYGIGYSRGEDYRARVHGGIAANARKAARKQKKKAQPRRQEPRQLV